jgi:hypothetical protein
MTIHTLKVSQAGTDSKPQPEQNVFNHRIADALSSEINLKELSGISGGGCSSSGGSFSCEGGVSLTLAGSSSFATTQDGGWAFCSQGSCSSGNFNSSNSLI